MRNRSLIVFVIILAALKISAQSSGYLEFVENKGQWDSLVRFKADIGTGSFFLHKKGFTVILQNPDDLARVIQLHHGGSTKGTDKFLSSSANKNLHENNAPGNDFIIHAHTYRVTFQDANEDPEIVPDKPLASYNNYFIGNDPSKWKGGCKIYQGVTYKNIYPNIDLRYYTNNGTLKYDLIVHPGGNPDKIIMKYEGADKLTIKNNDLLIKTSVATPKELAPVSYQIDQQGRKEVESGFFLASPNTIRFRLKNYSPNATLIIDPTLVFATFSGSTTTNWGFTATYGPDGSMYAGGIVGAPGFKVSTGAYQINYKGGTWDVGLMKFDPKGVTRVYGTYLGGTGNDYPHSLVVDPQGQLVVFGRTGSTTGAAGDQFPTTKLVGPGGKRDIYVTKFNATGTALIGSIRIGGSGDDGTNIDDQDENVASERDLRSESLILNYGDWSRGEVILDGANNIYVATCTQSADFPIVGAVFQPTFKGGTPTQNGGGQDAAIIKINPDCSGLIFSSFLGGTDQDAALVMDLSPTTGDIYVGGLTNSTDMPGIKAGALQSTLQGAIDGFVSIISNDGSTLKATTYLGTTGNNVVYGVKFDRFGFPYVMGTTSGTWPVINATWSVAGSKQFVAKLKPDLSAFVYSTTFGSAGARSPNISPVAFLVDRCQNVYVSGWGSFYTVENPDPYNLAGTVGMPVTPDAIQSITDGRDFYFIVIKRDATALLYGTFYGQKDVNGESLSEHVDGGTSRYDKNGVIYQAICANCNTIPSIRWPTTPGVFATKNGSAGNGGCNLAAVKIAFNFAGVAANIKSLINGLYDSSGCVPLDVVLEDTIKNAKTYVWSFGDGSPDTTTTGYKIVHTYNAIGTYLVRLIAIDSSTCNIADTAYLHISARNDKAPVSFASFKQLPCQALLYEFDNTSTYPAGKPFTPNSFIWDFGDGTTLVSNAAKVNHSYATAGTYNVRLLLVDTNYCNFPDSATQLLSVSPLVKAQFITPAAGCVPYNAQFNNTSLAGQQFFWDFGDGTTSTDVNPTHLYPNIGTYTIRLIAIDSNTCNIIDSTKQTITVSNKPHAVFTTTPIPPIANTPNIFYNSSTGAVRYDWFFGDGDSISKTTLDTVKHQYNETGTFNACLVVYNQYGCPDTACQAVDVIVNPLFDVPNAFTPGRFGENAIVSVKGFGIAKLSFKIYNRFGQKVFESNSQSQGWDGTFKGTPQPMDVYAYTVDVVFSDGKRGSKKGDITLIR